MKLKKILMTLLLTLGVGAGVATGVGATVEATQPKDIVEVEAATTNNIFYFRNDWNWTDICCHYWNNSNGTDWPGVKMTKVSQIKTDLKNTDKDYYRVEVPTGYNALVFNGLKDDGSGNRDQSPDIKSKVESGNFWYMSWNGGNKANLGAHKIYEINEYKILGEGNPVKVQTRYSKSDLYNSQHGAAISGYDYQGAYTNSAHTTKYNGTLTSVSFDIYHYYTLKPQTFSVTYNDGNNKTMQANTNCEYGKKVTLLPHSFQSSDKVFMGWATTNGGEVVYQNCSDINIAEGTLTNNSLTLYAVWENMSQNSFRIFLNRNRHYDGYGSIYNLHYWQENGISVEVAPAGYIEINSDNYFVYYNVKKELATLADNFVQFKIYDETTLSFKASTNHESTNSGAVSTYNSGDNAEVYVNNYDESKNEFYLSKGALPSSGFIKNKNAYITLLETYYTCSSDKDNGYGNADVLYRTWFYNKFKDSNNNDVEHWFLDTSDGKDHEDILLNDYQYDSTGNSDKSYDESKKEYTGEGSKTANYTNAWEKIQQMLKLQEGASLSNPVRLLGFNNSSTGGATLIIVISSISALCTLLVFLKFRKKEDK